MNKTIKLLEVEEPKFDNPAVCVELSDATIQERFSKILHEMKRRGLRQLLVYGDSEHGGNFEYLVGYFPRFEEALLLIKDTGEVSLILGNENLNKAGKARIENTPIHVSLFSLPHQPNREDQTFEELLIDAGLESNVKTGIVGWKMFTSKKENQNMFDVPYFIVDTVMSIVANKDLVSNEISLFIGENGVRITNNANEIAHYEYGASLASDCILNAMNHVVEGVTEFELGTHLEKNGQHHSVVTIAASGTRYIRGNMYPTNKKVQLGDPISLTIGYRGGLSSRAGYAVHGLHELPKGKEDYLDQIAIPYFRAYITWLNQIRIGMTGSEMFDLVVRVLPQSIYNWTLNPGHLSAEEEWLTSPIYKDSTDIIQSGMIFQVDIIPSIDGYAGANAESTIVLADDNLKAEIKKAYPEMWKRMEKRREYIETKLGIELSPDVLPMCSTLAYFRPYLLNHQCALCFVE